MNTLYYGDNLPVLRQYVPDESVDLIYLDPPFNSNRSYNVLYREESGTEADAQITAFDDTWHWGDAADSTYRELLTEGSPALAGIIGALYQAIGENQMMAYLVMMAARLAELHRVLKPTGSLYLHCDPSASHYLKVLLDAVFGAQGFVNEVVWKRTFAHGNVGRNYGNVTDSLLFYAKTDQYTWNQPYLELTAEETEAKYPNVDPDGRRWQSVTLRNPGVRPNLHFPYTASNGVTYQPHPNGWSCNQERLERYDREGRLHFPAKPAGALRLRMYADESSGERAQNLWDDIPPIAANAKERLGYPTQKPVALLERIIATSSNAGDLVLDPFCGCGTTIHAAQQLGRRWIGVDITHLSIALLKNRLDDAFGLMAGKDYLVVGEPVDLASARQLADDDRYQFQWWALSLVRARPFGAAASAAAGGPRAGKKGADQGKDGVITFLDDTSGQAKRALVQVKSGHVTREHIGSLRGTVEREKAQMGVFITLEDPTRPMQTEALAAGYYHSPGWNRDYPRLQIVTIRELLAGAELRLPPSVTTFRQAAKATRKAGEAQGNLFEQAASGHSLAADSAVDDESPEGA